MMKSKYTAATALLVWLLVTGWLATLVIAKPAVLRQSGQLEDSALMAELQAGIEQNQRNRALVARLTAVDGLPGSGLPVALPRQQPSQAAEGPDGQPAPVLAPQLSLVLVADGQRSAVIDGVQVRVGSRLADGSRVRAIGTDWVQVQFAGGARHTHRIVRGAHGAGQP